MKTRPTTTLFTWMFIKLYANIKLFNSNPQIKGEMELPRGYPYLILGGLTLLVTLLAGALDPAFLSLSLALISVGIMMSREYPSFPAAILACLLVLTPYLSARLPYLENSFVIATVFILFLVLEYVFPYSFLLVRYLLYVPLILWMLTAFLGILEDVTVTGNWGEFILHLLFLLLVFTDTMTLSDFWDWDAPRIKTFRLLATTVMAIMIPVAAFYAAPLSII